MMIATMFDRSSMVSDEESRTAWYELHNARRRSLVTFALLAPLTGLVGPLVLVPALGFAGWLLIAAGVLSCVGLLFYMARIDADMSDMKRPAGVVDHARASKHARHASRQPHSVQSLSGARARRAAQQLQLQPVFSGARRRPYRLAH
ncbi:Uncharacterised protein [Bordetella ansorpii]|uniref:Uncharacterized protein n=1 Tax=Bordetella ansorpii TaxID=288768 RepID=A0A146ANB2_9BORD|nr:hypothetical protein [Bordetella ansorpii]CZZ90652.1 Uncharacterised protein [Bordetella ansorpii]